MIDEFANIVPKALYPISGSVFYSGRAAFALPAPVYVLGLNPGGDPDQQKTDTIGRQIDFVQGETPSNWSAYSDESWGGRPPGMATFQRRVLHLFERLGSDPRRTPSSNLFFTRSRRLATLEGNWVDHADACWEFHRAVISSLQPRVVVCLGISTGDDVCRRTGADRLVKSFKEQNSRCWVSTLHANRDGLLVASLTHPSIAAWTTKACDPSLLFSDLRL